MKMKLHSALVAVPVALLLALALPTTGKAESTTDTEGSPVTEWHRELKTARAASHATGRLILVDLYADWCAWCKAMERQVFSTPRFQRYAAERFVLLRVDTMDRAEGARLKSRYGAETLPTILLLDGNMVEVARLRGFVPLPTFIDSLNGSIARYHELLSIFEQYRDSDDTETLETLAKEMLSRQDGRRAAHLLARLIELGGLSQDKKTELESRRQQALDLVRGARQAQEQFNPSSEANDEFF